MWASFALIICPNSMSNTTRESLSCLRDFLYRAPTIVPRLRWDLRHKPQMSRGRGKTPCIKPGEQPLQVSDNLTHSCSCRELWQHSHPLDVGLHTQIGLIVGEGQFQPSEDLPPGVACLDYTPDLFEVVFLLA